MTLRKGYMGELENRRVFMTYLKGFMTLEMGYMERYESVLTYLEGYIWGDRSVFSTLYEA